MTRTTALALEAYSRLRDECLRRYPDVDGMHDYIGGLHDSWASAIRRAQPLRYEGRIAVLLREIGNPPDLDDDAALRWLDFFPEAVVESARVTATSGPPASITTTPAP